MTDGFEIGARVRLLASEADRWVDQRMRRRAATGRIATVRRVFGTSNPAHRQSYLIEFDIVGREKKLAETVHFRELERAP